MVQQDTRRYLDCITEAKARLYAADDHAELCLSRDEAIVGDLEVACLNLRKSIELIGFSAMTAEVQDYSAVRPKFKKEWRFADVVKSLKQISPNSFPFGVRQRKSQTDGVKWHFERLPQHAIEPSELVSWHGKLNQYLHATNPFSEPENIREACRRIRSNASDILKQLRNHIFLRASNKTGLLLMLNDRSLPVTVFEFEESVDVL